MSKFKFLLVCLLLIVPLASGCGGSKEVKPLPPISDSAIELAISTIEGYEQVLDAAVVVKDKNINFALIVKPGTSKEDAMELGDNFVRNLSSHVAGSNPELSGPTKDSYGDLYNHYDIMIGVGTGPSDFITQGAKVRSAKKITW